MDTLQIIHIVCTVCHDKEVYGRVIDNNTVQFAHVTDMGLIITTVGIDPNKNEAENAFSIAEELLFDEDL